jgi:hypothetical protein
MEIMRWIGTVIVAGFFVGLTIYNWRFFFEKITKGDLIMSPTPWVGGLAGLLALWICPLPGAFEYWWVPFCIDFGSIPNSLWLAYCAATSKL